MSNQIKDEVRDVYLNHETNQISFTWIKNQNVCVGQTDEGLAGFLEFMRKDYVERGIDLSKLPTINDLQPAADIKHL